MSNLHILDTLGIKQPEITIINNEVAELPAVINNYPFDEFNKLVDAHAYAIERSNRNLQMRGEAEQVIVDLQQSLKDNEITDEDAEVFSVVDVNRLLNAMYLTELTLVRTYQVQVTVELTFSVEVEATDEDDARDKVVEDVEFNAAWDYALRNIEGACSDIEVNSVDGSAEEA